MGFFLPSYKNHSIDLLWKLVDRFYTMVKWLFCSSNETLRGPLHVRFRPTVKLFLPLVVIRFTRGEISPYRDFTSVLKTGVKFHPGANSVWFQRVTAINVQPGLILCAMLWLIQKILSLWLIQKIFSLFS